MEPVEIRTLLDELLHRDGTCPCTTAAELGIEGTVKARPADFEVEELPLYDASGEGDHLYFEVEKTGLSTDMAVQRIAAALKVRPPEVGIAGQKDTRAVTRQWMSLEHAKEEDVAALQLPDLRIGRISRHRNKLRIGHLRGNRFRIRIRNTDPGAEPVVAALLAELEQAGVPNYFGDQRFGVFGDNHLVGRALLREDYSEVIALLLGNPSEGPTTEARTLFEQGHWDRAADAWPRGFGEHARLCRTLMANGKDERRAVHSLPRRRLMFHVSALQSHLFNGALAARIRRGEFTRMLPGDVAFKHANGACFDVVDAAAETERARQKEISPTGPLFGRRMKPAQLEVGQTEGLLLSLYGLEPDAFGARGPFQSEGGRRPFRFFPTEVGTFTGEDGDGPYLGLQFVLPAGCYATVLLKEICKKGMDVR